MISLKYSCEEVYERMENGLCIFCEEEDTPGHQQLKHKRSRIVIMEREDDLASDVKEEAHQIIETVSNPEQTLETTKDSDSFIKPLVAEPELGSVYDVLLVHKVDLHVKEEEELLQRSTSGNGKIDAYQVFDKIPLRVTSQEKQRKYLKGWKFKFKANSKRRKSMNDKLSFEDETALLNEDHEQIIWDCVYKEFKETMTAHGKKRVDRFKLSRADRVWEPGWLQVKFDMWDWPEKELKPYGESHQVATFLYFQMQVVKSNPAEFKTFDKKRSNKTLSQVEHNDEHEQNRVRKLISSWNNQVWEPGGVSNEQDMWKWLDKCYEHSGVMRLMQRMSNTWWSYGKVVELTQKLQQPKTYLKGIKFKELDRAVRFSAGTETLLVICSCEYKIQKLLPCYHSLKVQEMQIFPEDKVEFPEVRLINMRKGLVCDKEKMELRNVKAAGCVCDLDQVNSLGKEEFVSFIEFSKRQLAMEFLVNPRLIHIKGILVFVALEVALALLIDFDHNKVRRTHYGKAEKVDKHKYTFIRKFAESIILATIDEHKYIKTSYVFLGMGLSGGTRTIVHLVHNIEDGAKKGNNNFLGDGNIILALPMEEQFLEYSRDCLENLALFVMQSRSVQKMELTQANEAITKTYSCQAHKLQNTTFIKHWVLTSMKVELIISIAFGQLSASVTVPFGVRIIKGAKHEPKPEWLEEVLNFGLLESVCYAGFSGTKRESEFVSQEFGRKREIIEQGVLFDQRDDWSGIEQKITSVLIKDQDWEAIYEWSLFQRALQTVEELKNINYGTNSALLGVKEEYDLHGRLKGGISLGSLTKKQCSMWGFLTGPETFSYSGMIIQVMVQRQWERFVMMLFVIAKMLILLSDPLVASLKQNKAVTKVLIQWKEHPPDQFIKLSSLRTRMLSTGEYCDRIIIYPGSLKPNSRFSVILFSV